MPNPLISCFTSNTYDIQQLATITNDKNPGHFERDVYIEIGEAAASKSVSKYTSSLKNPIARIVHGLTPEKFNRMVDKEPKASKVSLRQLKSFNDVLVISAIPSSIEELMAEAEKKYANKDYVDYSAIDEVADDMQNRYLPAYNLMLDAILDGSVKPT